MYGNDLQKQLENGWPPWNSVCTRTHLPKKPAIMNSNATVFAALRKLTCQTEGEVPVIPGINSPDAQDIVAEHTLGGRNRIYTPWITTWLWVMQALSPDGSCREIIQRFNAWRARHGMALVSPSTGAYCTARFRLPLPMLRRLVQASGDALHQRQDCRMAILGSRPIKMVDGTQVTMADTKFNQAVYPQSSQQAPGIGFPAVRIVALLCLATGAVIGAALGPNKGAKTGELSLLASIRNLFSAGDILVADRAYCSMPWIALLQQKRVDVIVRLHQSRNADLRKGQRLGSMDRLRTWSKPPPSQCPAWLSEAEFLGLPDEIQIRLLKRTIIDRDGKRSTLSIATTIADANANEIFEAYRHRWSIETDFRSMKCDLGMDHMRCIDYPTVEKEIFVHFLANNAVRSVAAESAGVAEEESCRVRKISYKAVMQTIGANWQDAVSAVPTSALMHAMKALSRQRVGNRPGRFEPRKFKRRPKSSGLGLLMEPRHAAHRRAGFRRAV